MSSGCCRQDPGLGTRPPFWQLTTACSSSFMASYNPLLASCASDKHIIHRHTWKQNILAYKIKINYNVNKHICMWIIKKKINTHGKHLLKWECSLTLHILPTCFCLPAFLQHIYVHNCTHVQIILWVRLSVSWYLWLSFDYPNVGHFTLGFIFCHCLSHPCQLFDFVNQEYLNNEWGKRKKKLKLTYIDFFYFW